MVDDVQSTLHTRFCKREQDADEIRQGCIKADIEQSCNYRLPPYLSPKHKQFGEHQQEGHRGTYNGIDAFVVVDIWHVRMGN